MSSGGCVQLRICEGANEETPIVKVKYVMSLRESEHRSTFPLPYWQIPGAMEAVSRQKQFSEDIEMINAELTKLILRGAGE